MFKKSLALVFGVSALTVMSAHAANVNNGDVLTIDAGIPVFDANGDQTDVISGSWFALDQNVNGKISGVEKVALSIGTSGLLVGVTTVPGASHPGCPIAGDTNAVDAPWCYFGSTGSDYVDSVPVTGGTVTGLDMRGWNVTWNGSIGVLDTSRVWGVG